MDRREELLQHFLYRPDEPGLGDFDWWDSRPVPLVSRLEALHDFLAFRVLDETYATPIERVREVVKVPWLTRVPRSPPELLGIMHLRGEALPVYDIRTQLLLSPTPVQLQALRGSTGHARIILIRSVGGDAGVLVDGVEGVIRLLPSTFEPAPMGTEKPFLTGLTQQSGKLHILLDLEKVI